MPLFGPHRMLGRHRTGLHCDLTLGHPAPLQFVGSQVKIGPTSDGSGDPGGLQEQVDDVIGAGIGWGNLRRAAIVEVADRPNRKPKPLQRAEGVAPRLNDHANVGVMLEQFHRRRDHVKGPTGAACRFVSDRGQKELITEARSVSVERATWPAMPGQPATMPHRGLTFSFQ